MQTTQRVWTWDGPCGPFNFWPFQLSPSKRLTRPASRPGRQSSKRDESLKTTEAAELQHGAWQLSKQGDSLIGSKTAELLHEHIWESPPKLMTKGLALGPQPPNTCRSTWTLDAPPVAKSQATHYDIHYSIPKRNAIRSILTDTPYAHLEQNPTGGELSAVRKT